MSDDISIVLESTDEIINVTIDDSVYAITNWGVIYGNIADQADLKAALDAKLNADEVVDVATPGKVLRLNESSQLDVDISGTAGSANSVAWTRVQNKPTTYPPSSHGIGLHVDWPAAVSMTEVGYLDGVTSGIQGQLDSKALSSHNHAGVYDPAGTAAAAVSVHAGQNSHAAIDTALGRLANTSGSNTGDQDLSGLVPKTTTVNGHTLAGNITVTASDVGLGSVNNTSDANKPISTATATALSGKADLVGGVVPANQLPSYVDDVLEYTSLSVFPGTGESGKIYMAIDTNVTYRWSGSAYVEISASLALGETYATAYRGDRGKTAYDHSQSTGNVHGITAADIGAQATLVSGTNIKTVNGASILGTGNIVVSSSSPYGFFKSDFASVAFVKTGAGTISVKAGTSALVNATTVSWAAQTAVTMPSHAIGNDYCIYACADGSIRADANATAPTGYDTSNSRKIGGYHYGRIRNSLTVTDVATEIVPRSLWDLTYRPKCNPAGMVDVHGNGSLWADIYLAAVDTAITLTSGVITAGTCKSIYNGTPLSGTEGLHGYNFIELAKNSGKRLLTHSEWLAVAHGSPQGNDGDNLNAWSATTNVARNATGQVARAVSFCGATDCVGNLWEWLDEWSNRSDTTSWNWYNTMTGQNVGQQYLPNSTGLVMYLAGGTWTNDVLAGSRALFVYYYPWAVGPNVGSRFACDGL